MDRVIVYDGALPQATDVLNTNKFALLGNAYQNLAMLGSSTVVAGLACLPTSPTPDLHVSIGVGSIYQLDPTDASAYGDLGIDNNSIMKQGILNSPVTLSITPPGTGGFSQVYLVQAILNDTDAGSTVLSYYNSAVPTSPFSGPANSGTSNFTTRTNPCTIALKAGVPAATGSQTTPSPDAGFVGLYAITVANGATQITSGNIVQLTTAPFFPTLPGVPVGVRNGTWVWGTDTGTTNHFIVTVAPIPAAYVAGQAIRFKAVNAVTGATDINVNGLGVVNVKKAGGSALATGDIIASQVVELVYDGVNFQMVNYNGTTGAVTNNFNSVGISYVVDSGAVNALVGTFSPSVGSYTAGLWVSIKLANTITGASTINANGLGVKNILLGDLTPTPPNLFVAGEVLLLVYDGTQFQVYGTTSGTYRKPIANTTIFVNGAIGNDANDGTSNVSGHALATIQGGVNKAFSYAPSQFTITIVVEPGVYNESVATPTFAGPNLIIDGLAAASVTVNGQGLPPCFGVYGANTLTVKNVTIASSAGGGFGAFFGGIMYTANTVSNAVTSSVFGAQNGGTMNPGTHSFSGSCLALFFSQDGGILIGSTAFTITTPISVSFASAVATLGGNVGIANVSPPTFTNAGFVSGNKFAATVNGTISGPGLGVNFLPGTTAGFTTTGGQASF